MIENQEIEKTIIPNTQSDEIDIIEVAKKIWEGRKTIYMSVGVCLLLGIVVIIGSPKEYKSEVLLLEENSSKGNGMSGLLSQFGGLAGLGNSGSNGSLSPEIYPEIIKSSPFLFEVINQTVVYSKNDSLMPVYRYLNNYLELSFSEKLRKYTIGLPTTIKGLFNKEKPEKSVIKNYYPKSFSENESKAIGKLSGRIEIKEGESAGVTSLSIETQDPIVSAQLVDSVVKSLTEYVIKYRIKKAQFDLDFVKARCEDAKIKYINAQQALAYHRDQNKNIILASSRTEEERLQAEFSLAMSVYTGLAQQLEQSKIKVQESTPVFKVIEPATLGGKSRPKTSFIIIIALFLGGLIGVGINMSKLILSNIKSN